MNVSTESLARAAGHHPWRTVLVWLGALLAAALLSSQLLGDALTTDTDFTDEPASKRAGALIEARLRGADEGTEFVVVSTRSTITDADYETFVGRASAEHRSARS